MKNTFIVSIKWTHTQSTVSDINVDYISAGTDFDYGDIDLEVNAVNSYTGTSIAPKQYKSFQPSIKLQPTDLIYREEHSRAAPRKGIEVSVFGPWRIERVISVFLSHFCGRNS